MLIIGFISEFPIDFFIIFDHRKLIISDESLRGVFFVDEVIDLVLISDFDFDLNYILDDTHVSLIEPSLLIVNVNKIDCNKSIYFMLIFNGFFIF